MSIVLLIVAALIALLARSATRRTRGRRPMWVTAMVGAEFAPWLVATCLVVAGGWWWAGWSGGVAGRLGLVLLLLATGGFLLATVRATRVGGAARRASLELTSAQAPSGSPWRGLVMPLARPPRDMTVNRAIPYGPHERHLLDHLGRSSQTPRPALVYVHGGGWWRGRRDTQARPVLHRMVDAGWQVFTPSYRLSPEATFPDHLVDVKRAVGWVRSNADDLGVDSRFIAVAGGSTGGNLAALAALNNEDRSYQPGFEKIDTSVQACVPFYGVHDMLRPDGRPMWPYLVPSVMKSEPGTDPERWASASPVRSVGGAPPSFLVVHGSADSLVGVDASRRLVAELHEVDAEVGYLEVPGANHGFDFFAGYRGRSVAAMVQHVLDHWYERAVGR